MRHQVDEATELLRMDLDVVTLGATRHSAAGTGARLGEGGLDVIAHAGDPLDAERLPTNGDPVGEDLFDCGGDLLVAHGDQNGQRNRIVNPRSWNGGAAIWSPWFPIPRRRVTRSGRRQEPAMAAARSSRDMFERPLMSSWPATSRSCSLVSWPSSLSSTPAVRLASSSRPASCWSWEASHSVRNFGKTSPSSSST